MIKAILCENEGRRLTEGGEELIERWRTDPSTLIWVVVEGEEGRRESSFLANTFGIHPLAITDALRDRHPPKVEAFEGSTFILLKGLDATSSKVNAIATIQLSLFIGERFLVTRSNGHSVSTEMTWKALLSEETPPPTSPADLALRLSRRVVDRFLPLLFDIETRLDQMEAELLAQPSDELLAELVQQKGDLKRLLRVLQYHCQVFETVRNGAPNELEGYDHEIADVHEQLERHLSLARLYYELTGDLMDGYLSLSSHRLNQVMQTLTIVTVIFVPITFMAGIYGMNFEYMPELGFRGAYFLLLGAMALVVSGALLYFRRRGWLGGRRRQ